ncbi:hypothetical protein FJ364_05870, partial [Candidatus Dependentiae bacterium]|nr:hypothetical protein [Candidatus Dependentiae bacterium]
MKNIWLPRLFIFQVFIMTFVSVFFLQTLSAATFEFSSPSSKLVLGDYNAGASQVQGYFKNTAWSKLIGFDQQSIVRGNSQANTFSNAWTFSIGTGTVAAGSTVSTGSITRDLTVTTSDMSRVVRTTSNAMASMGGLTRLVRVNSNWINTQFVALGDSKLGQHVRT